MLIIGCGHVGRAVGAALLARGTPVRGIVRSEASAAQLAALGIEPLRLDLEQDDLAPAGFAGQAVFHFAPPPGNGTTDPLTARLVETFRRTGGPRRLVYIGTTGVYGDCGGAWVDEDWPVNPDADRSWRRLDAERRLQDWAADSGAALVRLRVAGIYDRERLPLARIQGGAPVVRPAEAPWSNRIHLDDLVSVCLAAMERAPAGALYNVCDGHPSSMTDYFQRIADAAGLPRPPEIALAEAAGQVSAGMLSYLRESRRLRNRRLLGELGITLRYPTLADGLAACFPQTRATAAD